MGDQQFWINLPVKNMERAKEFYRNIGFAENERHVDNKEMGSFFIGKNKTVMMLFPEDHFTHFTQNGLPDFSKTSEVLLNLDAKTTKEVDNIASLVEKAGGSIFAAPTEAQVWMYVLGFADPDGHRWCVLYMDPSKMPENM